MSASLTAYYPPVLIRNIQFVLGKNPSNIALVYKTSLFFGIFDNPETKDIANIHLKCLKMLKYFIFYFFILFVCSQKIGEFIEEGINPGTPHDFRNPYSGSMLCNL